MIQIGDKIISRDLFEKHFICHLEKCEGNCCVFGDAGAPLEDEEAEALSMDLEKIIPYIRAEGKRAVRVQGAWVIDRDGEKVTPLIGREECAYVVFEDKIARCAIEQAFEEGAIAFRKPASCHLYPIRVGKLKQGVALNYHQWSVCEPGRILGEKQGMPVFRFLKDAIIRVYGKEFYGELEMVYRELIEKESTNT
jgi:hypothetical protein